MNFSLFAQISAFAGLATGLISFILIYRFIIKRANIEIIAEDFFIKKTGNTQFGFQLNLRLKAKRNSAEIKEIWLQNSSIFTDYCTVFPSSRFLLEVGVPLNRDILLKQETPFETLLTSDQLSMVGLRIEKGVTKSFTFFNKVDCFRSHGSYHEIPPEGWTIKVHYNDREAVKPLKAVFLDE